MGVSVSVIGRGSGESGRREKMGMLWHGIWPSRQRVVGHRWRDGMGL